MSTAYFETRVASDESKVSAAAWHPSLRQCALAKTDRTITIVNEEGARVGAAEGPGAVRATKGAPLCLAWVGAPQWAAAASSVASSAAGGGGGGEGGGGGGGGEGSATQVAKLVAGHADGQVTLHDKGKPPISLADSGVAHVGAVRVLAVSPSGMMFVTGDDVGGVSVWGIGETGHSRDQVLQEKHRNEQQRFGKGGKGGGVGGGSAATLPRLLFQHKKQGGVTHCEFRDDTQFVLVTAAGFGYLGDDLGHLTEVFKVGRPALTTRYFRERDAIVVITDDLVMSRFRFSPHDGSLAREVKVKLAATNKGTLSSAWIGRGLLATCASENVVRVWNLGAHDNYILSHDDEVFTALAFNPRTRVLATGTQSGKVLAWRYAGEDDGAASTDDSWRPMPPGTVVGAPVTSLGWSADDRAIYACTEEHLSLLSESSANIGLKDRVGVWQVGADRATLLRVGSHGEPPSTTIPLKTSLKVKGVDSDGSHCVVWSGGKAEVYEVGDVAATIFATFPTRAVSGAIRDRTLYLASGQKIEACNLQGSPKQTLTFSEPEGEPVTIDAVGSFLAAASRRGTVRVWDVSRREARAHGSGPLDLASHAHRGADERRDVELQIVSVRVNNDGSFVSILCDTVDYAAGGRKRPDTAIRVLDVDSGNILVHDFGPSRYPVSHHWDGYEPKLFACETRSLRGASGATAAATAAAAAAASASASATASASAALAGGSDGSRHQATEIFTLFATADHGIRMQDSFAAPDESSALIGLHLPSLYFTAGEGTPGFIAVSMRDFDGTDPRDDSSKRALLGFSLNISIGNMDEAYRCVKEIKSQSVWENMAKMCIKTRRLDVAEVCLGHMGCVLGARALREARAKGLPVEAQIGAVAVHLGLADDAAGLYEDSGRHDLLNELCRASGEWDRAIAIAETKDRVHLRTTHFLHARQLEASADFEAAIEAYEHSNCHRVEVPRMLHTAGKVDRLKEYIFAKPSAIVVAHHSASSSAAAASGGGSGAAGRPGGLGSGFGSATGSGGGMGGLGGGGDLDDGPGGGGGGGGGPDSSPAAERGLDPALVRWWARFCESSGDAPGALEAYGLCADHMSIVRMHCLAGAFDKAAKAAESSNSAAASFYLARQYESQDMVAEAISYFSRAKRFNHAARLAKENGMDAELLSLALQSGPRDMIASAIHFESRGEYDKAVLLYQKAGSVSKAVALCFRASLYESLRNLTDELGPDADPELLTRCGRFFTENGQFDKAVSILLVGGQHERALELALDNSVQLTEKMAERMTPDKVPGDEAQNAHRVSVLRRLARALEAQGQHQLAAKKFTQAMDKENAMRNLLRAGDTDKIIFFAEKSRQPSIYVMAANYLSTLPWHSDPKILKALITFYTKAKSYDKLASFYASCSTVEIDEFRNYEKALGALRESQKWLDRSKVADKDDRMAKLQSRILLVDKFVRAKQCSASNPDEMHALVGEILDDPDAESALRVGDVLAHVFEHNAERGQLESARDAVDAMVERGIMLQPFLDESQVRDVYTKLGVPCPLDEESAAGDDGAAMDGDIGEDNLSDAGDAIDDEAAFEEEIIEDEDDF